MRQPRNIFSSRIYSSSCFNIRFLSFDYSSLEINKNRTSAVRDTHELYKSAVKKQDFLENANKLPKWYENRTENVALSVFEGDTKSGEKHNSYRNYKYSQQLLFASFAGLFFSSLCVKNKSGKNVHSLGGNTGAVEEVQLAKVEDFQEGELYSINVHDGKSSVLVCKCGGQWYCTGALCPHYSAPLAKGVLSNDQVVCPWHDAAFDLKTGKPLHGPALDGIPTFPISEKDGKLYAMLPKQIEDHVQVKMCKRNPNDKRIYAILGGGPAALAAAETLRQNGYTVMIFNEQHLPYDRIVLSKNFEASIEKIKLRDEDFFESADIEVKKSTKVEKLLTKSNTIVLDNGEKIQYDKVLIATGGSPRRLQVPGSSLQNIFVLRNYEDAQKINQFAKKGLKVVVIGSSFIGMEVASSLAKKGASVSIVTQTSVPFENTLGLKVGNVFKNLLREKEIKFYANKDIKSFIGGKGDVVTGVELIDGDVIQADCVVLGLGVELNTNFIDGIELDKKDRSVPVDPFMRSIGNSDVYVAGDIAKFPYVQSGENTRVEHWVVAMQHGRVAAMNMINQAHHPYNHIPFFWSMLFGKSIRYAGHCQSFDDVICEGDLSKYQFVAYYVKSGKIVAVATMNNDPVCVAACEVMKMNKMPTPSEIILGIANSSTILQTLKESTLSTPKKL